LIGLGGFSQAIDFHVSVSRLTARMRSAKSAPKMSFRPISRVTDTRASRFFLASSSMTSARLNATSKYRHGRLARSAKPIASCGESETW
jgi:hypothetical protein